MTTASVRPLESYVSPFMENARDLRKELIVLKDENEKLKRTRDRQIKDLRQLMNLQQESLDDIKSRANEREKVLTTFLDAARKKSLKGKEMKEKMDQQIEMIRDQAEKIRTLEEKLGESQGTMQGLQERYVQRQAEREKLIEDLSRMRQQIKHMQHENGSAMNDMNKKLEQERILRIDAEQRGKDAIKAAQRRASAARALADQLSKERRSWEVERQEIFDDTHLKLVEAGEWLDQATKQMENGVQVHVGEKIDKTEAIWNRKTKNGSGTSRSIFSTNWHSKDRKSAKTERIQQTKEEEEPGVPIVKMCQFLDAMTKILNHHARRRGRQVFLLKHIRKIAEEV